MRTMLYDAVGSIFRRGHWLVQPKYPTIVEVLGKSNGVKKMWLLLLNLGSRIFYVFSMWVPEKKSNQRDPADFF